MFENMQIPVMLSSSTAIIGPAYADNSYKVVFDNLNDNLNYKLCMENGLIAFTSVVKATGTNAGAIKLTFTVKSSYTSTASGNPKVNVTTGSGGTKFYLRIIK